MEMVVDVVVVVVVVVVVAVQHGVVGGAVPHLREHGARPDAPARGGGRLQGRQHQAGRGPPRLQVQERPAALRPHRLHRRLRIGPHLLSRQTRRRHPRTGNPPPPQPPDVVDVVVPSGPPAGRPKVHPYGVIEPPARAFGVVYPQLGLLG